MKVCTQSYAPLNCWQANLISSYESVYAELCAFEHSSFKQCLSGAVGMFTCLVNAVKKHNQKQEIDAMSSDSGIE